jgi:hypothetical protein
VGRYREILALSFRNEILKGEDLNEDLCLENDEYFE